MNVTFESTTHSNVESLVQMRIDAMKESLERIGRFDPQRARDRFVSSFDPALCKFIVVDGVTVGFMQTRLTDDHLVLEHLYVIPEHQGKGMGSAVIAELLRAADAQSMAVAVGALRDSDSNRFYQRHGFAKTTETEWDIYYVRKPQ
ncbi:GNAT family N-acetyltransferase [Pandoraea sp. XY-2]|uniref:GNAT family N-acetyltransferase n=1 Tax=Pandoraea sp. XY-2 TaxID=2518599 RepID=UPI00101B1255|nr:GNAT family N-acetyltransferase [Pandoraea sp. XY-2]QBC30646.1 GNAT family N-acetyltransferase [Pandoraea sp. XY-2]